MTLEDITVSLITGVVSSVLVSKIFLIYQETKDLYNSLINRNFVLTIKSNFLGMEKPEMYRIVYPNEKDDSKIRKYYYAKMAEDIAAYTRVQPLITREDIDSDLRDIYDAYKMGILDLKVAVTKGLDLDTVNEQVRAITQADKELEENRKKYFLSKCMGNLFADNVTRTILCLIFLTIVLNFIQKMIF
ncbi:hypothetical protein LAD12857_29140 [Lacrimispora amygdalina]|uniref:Uncharacterized protein n=1 Tax=Lacrimispora amygdalina TaxID=253257 RepID=A0ABQ5M8T7_9FIRM